MMPPTSIDGTDITGATIDGQDVQEITVDGQTVFTAESLPVAYSNLVAWYPFDSSFYGGSNADDATALFNPGQSGDSTAYDGTVNGASFQSSGGVKDINAGANSGAYNFDGSNFIEIANNPLNGASSFTITGWVNFSSTGPDQAVVLADINDVSILYTIGIDTTNNNFGFRVIDGTDYQVSQNGFTTTSYVHFAGVYTGSGVEFYIDGVQQTDTPADIRGFGNQPGAVNFGSNDSSFGLNNADIDDIRFYDTDLSQSQINQIYQNTQP